MYALVSRQESHAQEPLAGNLYRAEPKIERALSLPPHQVHVVPRTGCPTAASLHDVHVELSGGAGPPGWPTKHSARQ